MKQWWPHYQWLKKNNVNMDGIDEHQKFLKVYEQTKSRMRVMDVKVSKQAREISKQIAMKKISEMRLSNAMVRDQEK